MGELESPIKPRYFGAALCWEAFPPAANLGLPKFAPRGREDWGIWGWSQPTAALQGCTDGKLLGNLHGVLAL